MNYGTHRLSTIHCKTIKIPPAPTVKRRCKKPPCMNRRVKISLLYDGFLSKIENKKVLLIDMDPQMNATQYTLTESQMKEILADRNKSVYGCLSPYKPHLPQE